MILLYRWSVIAVFFVALVGCDFNEAEMDATCDSSTTLCSCDRTSESPSQCTDYDGWSQDGASENCQEAGGTFSMNSCDPSGVVGSCTVSLLSSSTTTTDNYYSDASTGQAACILVGGDWN